ncbi:hypothetical protein Bca52824_069159 [Brassica carinata]|uniref:MATH domain-containing protein n=1 Tax=Brassica carinata TaxID=52824 RepID=A0A8X7U0S8_BRACI|nr:hypothetical protein Bca52824_069159 [Brassica carinata]
MSESSNNEDNGSGQSLVEDNSDGRRSHSDALVEWRSKHAELYGKHTWKIENYSENYKRELRSDVFDAGGYKWYISIYPTRWDDCNHLAVYLCLTNHEELRPGWSHFAQYTLALMNKDPQKSRYLDSVNQFQKKERDWGWSKFIELHKLHEGYIHDLDSLIIKAKVQVIRVDRPLRCLSSQYRRELVRVYLPYVENICWQFMEAERIRFNKLIQNKEKFQRKMDVVLNLAARIFFVMRQGTSTLMMDSLYSGWKAIEGQTKKKISRQRQMDNVELPAAPAPIVSVDQDMFVLVDDLLPLMQRTVFAPFRIKEVNGSQNPSKVGDVGGEYSKEAIVRDESRLTEVGRRTMEILVLAHIYSNKVKVAYKEDFALMMQEKLIHEEEEEKIRAEQRDTEKEESVRKKTESSTEKPDTLGESSPVHRELDASEIHHPSSEDTSRGRSSSISIPSGGGSSISSPNEVANGSYKGMFQTGKPRVGVESKGKTPRRKVSGANSLATETEDQPSRHASNHKSQSHSSETRRVVEAEAVISRIQEAHNPREHNPVSKDRGMVQTKEKSPAVFSPPKASPWNLPSVAQAKPEERGVFNVDTVPNRKAISSRSPLSDQASPSRDIQFHTVGSRAAVQKTTSPIPSLSRPLRAPTVSAARTSTTSFARSVSSTGRVSAPTHSQNYIPPSYKHAVVGSLSSDHSSSHSTGTSALLSVSNQSGFPIDVGSADVWSGGLLRTGGSSSNRDTTQSLMTDEFPHHGIINDLLEEEHGLMITSGYLRFPQWLNDVYSFLANMEISGRSRSYSNDGFKQSYMSGSSSSSSSLYGNGQMDGLTRQTRANMDL